MSFVGINGLCFEVVVDTFVVGDSHRHRKVDKRASRYVDSFKVVEGGHAGSTGKNSDTIADQCTVLNYYKGVRSSRGGPGWVDTGKR